MTLSYWLHVFTEGVKRNPRWLLSLVSVNIKVVFFDHSSDKGAIVAIVELQFASCGEPRTAINYSSIVYQ